MLVYWILFLLIAGGALMARSDADGRSWPLFIAFASIPTILMIGLRWEVGPDWPAYVDIYDYTRLYPLSQNLAHADPGYFTTMWVLHQFDAPFWVLNMVCGLVFVAGLTAFARRQPNPWLAFLVAFPYLVIVVAMSGNRQSMALGLMFFALNAFERERLVKFTALILLAGTFHGSVLLVLPFGLLSYSRNGLMSVLLLLFAAVMAYYLSRDAFAIYANRYTQVRIQSTGVAYRLAMNGLAAGIFLLYQRRFALEEHQAKLWRNMSLATLALVPLLLVIPSSTAIDRFLLYLFPLQFVILSRVPSSLGHDARSRAQFTFMVVGYAALVQIVFLMFGKFAQAYIPYQTIFSA